MKYYSRRKACEHTLFSTLHFWLVFTDRSAESNGTVIASHEVNILLDSQFALVRLGSGKDEFILQDVYKIMDGSSLVMTPERGWSLGQRFPAGSPKNDWQCKTALGSHITAILQHRYFLDADWWLVQNPLFQAEIVTSNRLALMGSLLDDNHISFAVAVTCNRSEDVLIAKFFSNTGIRVKIQYAGEPLDVASLLSVDMYKLAVFLDWQCEGSTAVLKEASERKLFSTLHFWLVFTDRPADSKVTVAALQKVNIFLDSQFTLVRSGSGKDEFLLQEVYKILDGSSLVITPERGWSLGQRFPAGPPRNDFGGIVFRTAAVVLEDEWKNYLDVRYKHINSFPKYAYVQTEFIARYYNFRTNVTQENSWGYPKNATHYDGVVGLLQRGDIEVSSAGVMIKTKRWDIIDYSGESGLYEGTFMFLEPSLSEISNIYTLPFSRAVWLAYFVIMTIFTVAMYVSQNAEDRLLNSKQAEPVTMIESIFTSIAVICQEGATRDPKIFSFRILFLSFLMLSLFVTVSYSAIIVSLLQTTSSAIQTFKDLLDSPFKMSMKDFVVNRNYINETTDRDIRALYYKKLYTQPQSEAFTSTEIGVKNVRLGLHAFHGEADAFKIISETFDEYEKCRLKRIKMFSTLQVAFAVPKGSPHREHITRGARWLKESGLSDREYKFWVIQFPKCQGHTESFTSVRIQDFYPALLVLAYGAAISVGILVLEMVYFKIRSPTEHSHKN
ncbi:ionotropic receptor 75a-like [Periplaneta americana]|uniref:ionotropic receptor 75a-like n=1 Tax=Periplaneta americana TaxID=6978 RepID=UPI0037E94464